MHITCIQGPRRKKTFLGDDREHLASLGIDRENWLVMLRDFYQCLVLESCCAFFPKGLPIRPTTWEFEHLPRDCRYENVSCSFPRFDLSSVIRNRNPSCQNKKSRWVLEESERGVMNSLIRQSDGVLYSCSSLFNAGVSPLFFSLLPSVQCESCQATKCRFYYESDSICAKRDHQWNIGNLLTNRL